MKQSCAVLLAVVATAPLGAQLSVSRHITVAALDSGRAGFLPRMQFFGEAQRSFDSAEDELAWDVKLGGVLELYRSSARWSLVGVAGHELNANPFNSIGFNPRGAIWEEMLFVTWRGTRLDWHFGAFHRCRHEIDNADPPDESAPPPAYTPTERLLSLTGFQVGLVSKERSLGSGTTVRGLVRLERYATTTDNRTPRNSVAPYWKRALGATAGGARVARTLETGQIYARGYASLMYFSRGPGATGIDAKANWRSEVGLRATGAAGAADVFVAYESTFDDVSRPTPQRSRLFGVGVRFGAQ